VAPTQVGELVRACQAGDMNRAREHHYDLLPLMNVLFCETNPIPVKTALGLMGLIDPEIRLPLTPISDANRERIQVVLKERGHL
jgi:4-hydroxy-tetrahydrodipicolinate synthase